MRVDSMSSFKTCMAYRALVLLVYSFGFTCNAHSWLDGNWPGRREDCPTVLGSRLLLAPFLQGCFRDMARYRLGVFSYWCRLSGPSSARFLDYASQHSFFIDARLCLGKLTVTLDVPVLLCSLVLPSRRELTLG